MKSKVLLILIASATLAACGTRSQTIIGRHGVAELQNIKHICILETPKSQSGFTQNIQKALEKQGFSSEVVNVITEQKRLYEPECRYNLRYSGKPGQKIAILIRTPDYPVIKLLAPMTPTQDLQKQTDNLIARLLGKSTQ